MSELKLLIPTPEYGAQVMDFREEMLAAGSSMDGTGSLRRCESIEDYLAENARFASPDTVPEGRVCSTQFVGVRQADDKVVGMLQIRHWLNDYLAQYGGHIGYCVRPSERRKGYAGEMLALALPYCREVLKLDKVLITCLTENEASRRTILSQGGVYDGTVHEEKENIDLDRYWITL